MKNIIWDLDGTLFDTWSIHVAAIKEVSKIILKKNISLLQIISNQSGIVDRTLINIFGVNNFTIAKEYYVSIFCDMVKCGELKDTLGIKKFS